MARGWESKSVEEQQSQFVKPAVKSNNPSETIESRRRANDVKALQLQRARVAEQLRQAQNARFIELMQKELEFLDQKLRSLASSHN